MIEKVWDIGDGNMFMGQPSIPFHSSPSLMTSLRIKKSVPCFRSLFCCRTVRLSSTLRRLRFAIVIWTLNTWQYKIGYKMICYAYNVSSNYAYAMTKALGRSLFYRHNDYIMGRVIPPYCLTHLFFIKKTKMCKKSKFDRFRTISLNFNARIIP